MASKFTLFLILATGSLSQKVDIFFQIPSDVNQCVKPCLFRPNNDQTDVGSTLNCRAPYLEKCYCATNSKQAKQVSEHIDSCAKASCSAGVETQDASSMRSYYASYCMENGYTADAMTEWFTGTVAQEATKTDDRNNMWGWSTETSIHRAKLFDDDEKEGKEEDNSGTSTKAVGLFLGIPFLVVSLQLV